MITLDAPRARKVFPRFNSQPGKSRWGLYFLLALALHALVLCGSRFAFIHPPEYGIQSSSASIDVYMVAALPEAVEMVQAIPAEKETIPDLPEVISKAEMTVPVQEKKEPRPKAVVKKIENEVPAVLKKDISRKTAAAGDGSSPDNPGENETTFFSRASAEIAGKAGKYQNPPPQYPYQAQQRGWEGVVVLKALIKAEGRPERVVIERTSGHRILDKTALKAVEKWKFVPGRVGNITVSSWIKIPIRFELEKDQAAPF